MKKRGLIFVLILIVYGRLAAQDTARLRNWRDSAERAIQDTSRINFLRRIGLEFTNSDPDSAAYYYRKGIAYSRKIGWLKGEAQNLLNLGTALANASKPDSAIVVDGLALAAAIKLGDSNRIALVYINRGTAYTESSQFENALSDLTAAMRIAEVTGNKERKARTAMSLAEFYTVQDKFSAALPWNKIALQLETEIGDTVQTMICKMNLGGTYVKNALLPDAEKILMEAVNESKRLHRSDIFIECALSLSDLYMQQRKPDLGIAYLTAALQPANKLGIVDRQAILQENLGNAYLQKNNPVRALEFFTQGSHYVENSPAFTKFYYECLFGESRCLAELKRYPEAYEKSTLAGKIKDSFLTATQNERASRLESQFETERRVAEIALLQKDKQLAGLALQRQKSIRSALVVFAVLLLGIGALSLARYRVVQQNRQLMQMEKLRQSISRDLHDDIGSSLSSIHINSQVALDQSQNAELVRERLDKIHINAGKMMQGMSDIVWAINPANDSIENLILRMKEFSAELLEPAGIAVHFSDRLGIHAPVAGLEKRREIFMIFKEAVNNVAKYSCARNVWIDIETSKQNFSLTVKDDGRGFDGTAVHSGNGIKNIDARASGMKGKAGIQSSQGKGSSVSLEVPIP